MAAVNKLLTT